MNIFIRKRDIIKSHHKILKLSLQDNDKTEIIWYSIIIKGKQLSAKTQKKGKRYAYSN